MSSPTPSHPRFPIPSTRRREPYSIERHQSAPGSVQLIGYDGRGDWMVAVEILPQNYSPATLDEMRRWMMDNDHTRPSPPALTLVPPAGPFVRR